MCTRAFNSPRGIMEADGSVNQQKLQAGLQETFLVTGRNMDWALPIDTDLMVFRKGEKRLGVGGTEKAEVEADHGTVLSWEAQYDSAVAVCGYSPSEPDHTATADGINSQGLVANVLYLAGSTYASGSNRSGKTCLSTLRWVQYVLDTCATVDDVVKAFGENAEQPITIIGGKVPLPDGVPGDPKDAELHLSVSDRHGDSAILEVHDTIKIYHQPYYRIMTNQPVYEMQLVLNTFWKWQWSPENTNPTNSLPGTNAAADRFARASYYLNNVDQDKINHKAHPDQARAWVATMFSILASASCPLFDKPFSDNAPNAAPTLWSTVGAHQTLRYYYRDFMDPSTLWINLNDFLSLEGTDTLLLKRLEQTQADPRGTLALYGGPVSLGDFQAIADPYQA